MTCNGKSGIKHCTATIFLSSAVLKNTCQPFFFSPYVDLIVPHGKPDCKKKSWALPWLPKWFVNQSLFMQYAPYRELMLSPVGDQGHRDLHQARPNEHPGHLHWDYNSESVLKWHSLALESKQSEWKAVWSGAHLSNTFSSAVHWCFSSEILS